jgi:tetratricopeptide (TPR) repeat protein
MVVSPGLVLADPVVGPSLEPYASTCPDISRALSLARSGRVDDGVAVLESLKGSHGTERIPGDTALAYLQARLLEDAGRSADALVRYGQALASPLADEVLLRRGRLRLSSGDVPGARADFGLISRWSRAWFEARLSLVESLVREGRPEAARVVVNDLFRDDPGPRDIHAVRMARISVLEAIGDPGKAGVAGLDAYINAPNDGLARSAEARLKTLGAPPSKAVRFVRDLVRSDSRELKRLRKAVRSRARAFDAIDPGLGDVIRGVVAMADRKIRNTAAARFESAMKKARDPVLREFAAVRLGEALVTDGDDASALDRFRGIIDDPNRGPFAARAAWLAARTATRTGDLVGARDILNRLVLEQPESGYEPRARWELALVEMLDGRHENALARLDDLARRMDSGRGLLFGTAEKVRYFRGVTLWHLGRAHESLADLERVAKGYPHSYYSVLAATRLVRQNGSTALLGFGEAGPDECGRYDGPVPDRGGPVLGRLPVTGPRHESLGPLLLWRLGFAPEAMSEMRARARHGHLERDGAWLLAAMEARGRSLKGAAGVRETLRGSAPPGFQDLLAAAYPRPYAGLVEEMARANGVDEAFVYAVMRAESGFNPRARSSAGAIGLMQLMPATARHVASVVLGDRRKASGLWRPGNNLSIGVALLAALDGHFKGHLPLVLVGYHAGSGAGRRFHRNLGHLPTDLFVEALPYGATVAYIKRVVALTSGYREAAQLRDRGPLLLAETLPRSLGPFLERSFTPPGS